MVILYWLVVGFVFFFCLNLAYDKLIRPHLHEDKMEGIVEDATEEYAEKTLSKTIKEKLKL